MKRARYLFSNEAGYNFYQAGNTFFKTKDINTEPHFAISVEEVCNEEMLADHSI